jgi:hypothetical protein
MWADAGGILIANTVAESGNSPLMGLNDQTGVQEWSTPITGTSGNVCAVTSTQILNAVNNQLAVLSTKIGKQLSFEPNPENSGDNQCLLCFLAASPRTSARTSDCKRILSTS